MRNLRVLAIGLVALVAVAWQGQNSRAFHDPRGGHIDFASIDMGPPGVAVDVEGNGRPAVGDRNDDGIPDAEGYDTPDPYRPDVPGICGNGLDDDAGVFSSGNPRPPDGVADDGCVVPLTPLEQCAEIIDDGVLNADEDLLVGGQDMAAIDITVGAQPGPGGGIPPDRPIKAWRYIFRWDADVIDVHFHSAHFLILSAGAGQPFAALTSFLPDFYSTFYAEVIDGGGPPESGPGVIARLIVEGNAAGMANLVLTGAAFEDYKSEFITMDKINTARVAVSKDVNGDTVIAGPDEVFTCATPASATPTPTPLPTPTPTPTPTAPTHTPAETPTPAPTPSPTATAPTATPAAAPTAEPTPIASPTPTITPAPGPAPLSARALPETGGGPPDPAARDRVAVVAGVLLIGVILASLRGWRRL